MDFDNEFNLENLLIEKEQDTLEQELRDLSDLLVSHVYDDQTEQLYNAIKGKILSDINYKTFSAPRVLQTIKQLRKNSKNIKYSMILEDLVIDPFISYHSLRK